MIPDLINGAFELSGAYFVWLSVRKLLRDRQVRGVDWRTTAFWTLWGAWNVFYYPHLDQWTSFAGGVAVLAMNALYLALLLRYREDRALRAWYTEWRWVRGTAPPRQTMRLRLGVERRLRRADRRYPCR